MQKLCEVKYEGPKKTIQSKFSEEAIKEKLKGYTALTPAKFKDIKPGDDIRYMTNNAFKSGGRIKSVKFPDYIVCMNVFKKVTWCVQFKDPTLKIWVRTIEARQKDQDKDAKILKLYKEGKLVPKKK